ncbi:cation:dicarboxylase symporter family transporter, partial [Acinetobacter baumannii]
NLKKVGKIGLKSLIYFEIVTTLALAMGIAVALVIKPGEIDKTNLAIQDASKYTKNPATSFDWIQFFNSNLTLQVLLFSILFGIALS